MLFPIVTIWNLQVVRCSLRQILKDIGQFVKMGSPSDLMRITIYILQWINELSLLCSQTLRHCEAMYHLHTLREANTNRQNLCPYLIGKEERIPGAQRCDDCVRHHFYLNDAILVAWSHPSTHADSRSILWILTQLLFTASRTSVQNLYCLYCIVLYYPGKKRIGLAHFSGYYLNVFPVFGFWTTFLCLLQL